MTASAPPQWRRESAADLRFCYGLSLAAARERRLYASAGRPGPAGASGVVEPAQFCEPGRFVVRDDGTLFFAAVQNAPFARPPLAEPMGGLDFMRSKQFAARGEVDRMG